MRLAFERRTLCFERRFVTSYGELHERELLAVAVTGEDGITGYGEAAPLEPYDGVSIERAETTLERYRPVLARSRGLNGAQLLEACRVVDDLPQALAAIDLALWDRAGRASGKPLAALITDDPAPSVPVNAMLSALDRAGVAEQATTAARDGFTCAKLKVGAATTRAGSSRRAPRRDAARPATRRERRVGLSRRPCARSMPSPPRAWNS